TIMEIENLWKKILGEMEEKVSRANFATWLKNSNAIDKKDGGVLLVGLPNNFAKEWVENKYQKDLLGITRIHDDTVRKLEFCVANNHTTVQKKIFADTSQITQNKIRLEFQIDPETNLNSRYTIDSFVVGSSNELAYAAATAIIDNIGKKYNPFFIYGGVGLGKTHLIQAIGNEVKKKYNGNVKSRYVTSEKFTNDVIWGMRNKRMEDMKNKYRNVDVLIIDDIQFIGGKERTEEEFFHTFNTLYENNKQIIISSDRPPQAIPTLEDRLRSRFEGGLIADISFYDYETRVAIIKSKLQENQQSLTEEAIDAIARRIKKNIRELEGIVNKIIFYKESKKAEVTKKIVDEIIDKSGTPSAKPINENQILQAVTGFYNIEVADLAGRCRKKEMVEPRQIAMFLLRDMLGLSYPFIGEKMGRDHTTAIHSYEKINTELSKNSKLNQKIFQIKELIHKS
ncbi:MAG: hypothetical protein RIQ54_533, partial [Candidatus Parcubacteria bacterium]